MRQLRYLSIGAVLFALGAHAQAVSTTDQTFLQKQAQGTSYELAIAKLAAQKATKPDMRNYAQMVVTDHDQLNSQLQQLAQSKGVTLPSTMTAKQQANLSNLQDLTGSAFDRQYLNETTRINKEDKQQDQQELSATQDFSVRSFVQTLQSADQKHYKAAQNLK